MENKPNPRGRGIIVAILALIVLALTGYALWQHFSQANASERELKASGTIEARTVNVAPEVGGRVVEVSAEEGQSVAAGQVLVRLDDSAMQSQHAQALAAVQAARANYDLLTAGPTAEQLRQAEAAVVIATANYSRTVQGSRKSDIDAARAALKAASDAYNKVKAGPQYEDYAGAEASLRSAEAALKQAQYAYDNANRRDPAGIGASPAALQLEQATNAYNAARAAFDRAARQPDNAQISSAYQAVQSARAALERTQNPARDFDVEQVKAQVDQARAQLDALKAGPRAQQVESSKAQIASAEAQLSAIEVQMKKMTLTVPIDGIVLARNIEPGEMASPGATLFTIGKLDRLELTVYLPEEKFALVKPGMQAIARVDAYPSREFTVTVLRIADHAEFTPRNVQTVEGRKDTVFAVRLSLDNADLALKPGMPADVLFPQP